MPVAGVLKAVKVWITPKPVVEVRAAFVAAPVTVPEASTPPVGSIASEPVVRVGFVITAAFADAAVIAMRHAWIVFFIFGGFCFYLVDGIFGLRKAGWVGLP
jgi:hypothetical protein